MNKLATPPSSSSLPSFLPNPPGSLKPISYSIQTSLPTTYNGKTSSTFTITPSIQPKDLLQRSISTLQSHPQKSQQEWNAAFENAKSLLSAFNGLWQIQLWYTHRASLPKVPELQALDQMAQNLKQSRIAEINQYTQNSSIEALPYLPRVEKIAFAAPLQEKEELEQLIFD